MRLERTCEHGRRSISGHSDSAAFRLCRNSLADRFEHRDAWKGCRWVRRCMQLIRLAPGVSKSLLIDRSATSLQIVRRFGLTYRTRVKAEKPVVSSKASHSVPFGTSPRIFFSASRACSFEPELGPLAAIFSRTGTASMAAGPIAPKVAITWPR